MKLSENQEVVEALKRILLENYDYLGYDEVGSRSKDFLYVVVKEEKCLDANRKKSDPDKIVNELKRQTGISFLYPRISGAHWAQWSHFTIRSFRTHQYREYKRRTRERNEKYLREYKEYERRVEEERCRHRVEAERSRHRGTLLFFPPDPFETEVYPIEVCMKKRGAPESMIERLNEILGIFQRFANPSYNAYFNYSFKELVDELKGFRCGVPDCCYYPKTVEIVGRRFIHHHHVLPGHFESQK